MIKEKHRLERKYRKKPITYGAEYSCLRNRVKKYNEKATKLYYNNKVETGVNKCKASYDVIAEVLDNSKSDRKIGDSFVDCNTCNDDGIKVNHANEFFTNIGHSLGPLFTDVDSFLSYLTNDVSSPISFERIIFQELELLEKNFQHNSPGHDDLCISICKENFDLLGEALLSICNKILSQGMFPSQLKL